MEAANKFLLEFYNSVDHRVQSRITTNFYVVARMEFGTMLTDNDFAFFDTLVAKDFNAKAF